MTRSERERILIIALPGVGDALLATPMIELLRKAKPDAEIHTLVMFRATEEMFQCDPCIDRVHFYDFIKKGATEVVKAVLALRKYRFDVSLNIYPQNRREYNIIARIIGATKRLGIIYRRQGKRNLNWINTDTIVEDDLLHCVEENVRLLTLLGVQHDLKEATLPKLRLNLKEEHKEFATKWLGDHHVSPKHSALSTPSPRIGMHAGTALFKNHIKRRWDPEKFAALAKRLKAEMNASVFLFGGPDDISANEIILRESAGAVIPVETKSILDSIAIMQAMDLFVSNDSALMHIAGCLELPTVAIFGPTNEVYVHPWKTKYSIVHTGIECRPCFAYSPKPLTCYRANPEEHFMCIRDINVERVFSEVKALL